MLGDEAINLICGLLPPDGAKSGEQGPAEGMSWYGLEELSAEGREHSRKLRALTVCVQCFLNPVRKEKHWGLSSMETQASRLWWAGKVRVSNGPGAQRWRVGWLPATACQSRVGPG